MRNTRTSHTLRSSQDPLIEECSVVAFYLVVGVWVTTILYGVLLLAYDWLRDLRGLPVA